MEFYSTKNRNKTVTLKEAVLRGIADDGGLLMPVEIPRVSNYFLNNITDFTFNMIAYYISLEFFGKDIRYRDLEKIVERSITFNAPLISLSQGKYVLELFHGPTLAFKDIGARFMANLMSYLNKDSEKEIFVLAATSGDTGSAVADSFYKVEGIKVFLLYPGGKISKAQEQQLTTLGENIVALEISGTFDDCQRLVRNAFADNELTSVITLSSANSINISRLLPQSFYYFYAYALLENKDLPFVFSVPSGNLGNLTAGLIAKKMGLRVDKFIAATNANNVFTDYLNTSIYQPKPSVQTLSNAMDVGHPSNFERILDLYNYCYNDISKDIFSRNFSDKETVDAIKETYSKYKYIIDPHGAVGYLALEDYVRETGNNNINGIVLETAHYSKFADIVEDALNIKVAIPDRLKECLEGEKNSVKISNNFNDFKEFLLINN